MKRRQMLLVMFGASLLLASNSISIFAQMSGGGGGTGGGTGTGGTGGGASSGGLGGGGLSGSGSSSGSSGFLSSGSSFAAGGLTATTRGGGAGGGGTTSTPSIPTTSNVFSTTYANPLSLGMSANYYPNAGLFGAPNTAPPTFGKALYTATNQNANVGGFAASNTAGAGFATIGIPRAPVYTTVLNDDIPFKSHPAPELFANVRAVLERSNALRYKDTIQVNTDGATVVLRGQVGSEKERRIAEGIVRMTPGVRSVQNELTVFGATNGR